MRRILKHFLFNRKSIQIRHVSNAPIVHIKKATFYRQYPTSLTHNTSNPPIFPDLDFEIPSFPEEPQHWAIAGPSSSGKTTFLEILQGQHICHPPTARSFPYLSSDDATGKIQCSRLPSHAIHYVGFNAKHRGSPLSGSGGAYLGARYESRREETDFSLLDYLKGNTSLNPLESCEVNDSGLFQAECIERVIDDLSLQELVHMPLGNLSNGQTRRAMIAKALMGMPELLLLDEPFMGLDPLNVNTLSPLLHRLSSTNSPRLVLAFRPQDPLPEWITHVAFLGSSCNIKFKGSKDSVLQTLSKLHTQSIKQNLNQKKAARLLENNRTGKPSNSEGERSNLPAVGGNVTALGEPDNSRSIGTVSIAEGDIIHAEQSESLQKGGIVPVADDDTSVLGEPLIEMEGIHVKYGQKEILGAWNQEVQGRSQRGLWWTVRRGERWGMFGPNGSGKTTILSLITSDHPQSYSLPITIFGQSRLPQLGRPGISIFDIQARIGHSSPEIHTVFPRNLTLRQTLENAWADAFLAKPVLSYERDALVDACLRWFRPELDLSAIGSDDVHQVAYANIKNVPLGPNKMKAIRMKTYHRYLDIDTDWADEIHFGDVPFSSQRVALFLRAIVRSPDLVILDEAFSGMDERVREKCMFFLRWGERRLNPVFSKAWAGMTRAKKLDMKRMFETEVDEYAPVLMPGLTQDQALICVSHVREEVPEIVKDWMCLPEASDGQPVRFGHFKIPMAEDHRQWNTIWDTVNSQPGRP